MNRLGGGVVQVSGFFGLRREGMVGEDMRMEFLKRGIRNFHELQLWQLFYQ